MIVRFISDNGQIYDDYREWTEGYLDVPSMEWLKEKEEEYRKHLLEMLPRYDLNREGLELIIRFYSVDRIKYGLIEYLNDIDDLDPELSSSKKDLVRRLYFLTDLIKESFYKFIVENYADEVRPVEIEGWGPECVDDGCTYNVDTELYNSGINPWEMVENLSFEEAIDKI